MAIVYATYFRAADAGKTAASLDYVCRRPGRDLTELRRQGQDGRAVHTPGGGLLDRTTAGDRFRDAVAEERSVRIYRVVLSTKDVPLRDEDYHAVARQLFGERYVFVRHDGHSHPHAHVLARTDGRGLMVPELNAMRHALAEREQAREREAGRAEARHREQDRGMEAGW